MAGSEKPSPTSAIDRARFLDVTLGVPRRYEAMKEAAVVDAYGQIYEGEQEDDKRYLSWRGSTMCQIQIGMSCCNRSDFFFFFLMTRPPPRSPLFPHPTLFQSRSSRKGGRQEKGVLDGAAPVFQVFSRGLPGSILFLPSIKPPPPLDGGKRWGFVPAVKPGS